LILFFIQDLFSLFFFSHILQFKCHRQTLEFGERASSRAGPTDDVRNARDATLLNSFKHSLKTYLLKPSFCRTAFLYSTFVLYCTIVHLCLCIGPAL